MEMETTIDKPGKGWKEDGNPERNPDLMRGDLSKKVEQYTVFLVEDDADDRRLAVDQLRKSPYVNTIHSFENGDKLIRHFITEGFYNGNLIRYLPNLIILDIHVPGSNGIEILQKLKENPMTEDIPVIILTGDTSGRAVMDTYKSRANGFISKPLNLEQVHQVIETGWGWPNDKIPQ